MPKTTRAPRTALTPADRMKSLRTAILRTKLALPADATEQGILTDALAEIEGSLKIAADDGTEITGEGV